MIQSSGMKPNVEDTKEVVRVGLGEREASVKRAAKKLVASWVDAAGGDLVKVSSAGFAQL